MTNEEIKAITDSNRRAQKIIRENLMVERAHRIAVASTNKSAGFGSISEFKDLSIHAWKKHLAEFDVAMVFSLG